MSLRSLLPAAALVLALGLSSLAVAAAPPPSANPPAKVRVHVDTDFFGFTHYNPENSDSSAANVNTLGFGIGRLSLIDGGAALFDRSLLGIGVGGVILGGRAVVGARVAFVVDGFLREGGNDTALGGRLVPYFNYMFNPSGRVRPYIGARFGFGGGAVTSEEEFGGAVTRSRFSVIYPIVGAQGGAHIFLVERVSLDAGLSFDYVAPFGKAEQIEPAPPPGSEEPGFEQAGNVFNVAVTLGLSAWF
jgi:hypothetical protein